MEVHDSETPAVGQQVITVCAFIHQEIDGKQKVFLPKRAATKKFLPNVFELPGGHVEFGEELIPALKREIQEEFDMQIVVGMPFAAFTYENPIKQSHSVEIVYFAKFSSPTDDMKLNPEDHSEFVWLGANELERAYTSGKGAEDEEMKIIARGLKILNSGKFEVA